MCGCVCVCGGGGGGGGGERMFYMIMIQCLGTGDK